MTRAPIDPAPAPSAEPDDDRDELTAEVESWLDDVGRALQAETDGGQQAVSAEHWRRVLLGPARGFLSRRGKALRASLTEQGWRLGGGEGPCPTELRLVVELLHAGSLIVDDVEDGGARRRDGHALHELHGVPIALNVGNWLYFAPLELLRRLQLAPPREVALHRAVVRTVRRAHEGQALDLGLPVFELRRQEVPGIVATATASKTGALTELAATLGPIACGARPHVRDALGSFGRRFGSALQMLNDLHGLRDPDAEDLRHNRVTWAWAWLASRRDDVSFARMQRQARSAMHDEQERRRLAARLLRDTEQAGLAASRAELRLALDELRQRLPDTPTCELESEIERVARAYR